jgi:hypothetical protein
MSCEILLPPTGHYMQINVVNIPSGIDYIGTPYDFDDNFLNLIVTQSATNSTFLDDSIVAATNFVPIGMAGYYGAQISLTNSGTHTIISSQPVSVEVYGFGKEDAYGYFGGVVK